MAKQYCSRCKKMTEARDYGAGPFCSKCFHYFDSRREAAFAEGNSGNAPRTIELRENSRPSVEEEVDQVLFEADLTESFVRLGLGEGAAKAAAHGRRSPLTMVESFEAMGLDEASAKVAAKGRDFAHFLSDEPRFTDAELGGWVRSKENKADEFDAAEIETTLTESFVRLGLGEGAAKVAAQGRG